MEHNSKYNFFKSLKYLKVPQTSFLFFFGASPFLALEAILFLMDFLKYFTHNVGTQIIELSKPQGASWALWHLWAQVEFKWLVLTEATHIGSRSASEPTRYPSRVNDISGLDLKWSFRRLHLQPERWIRYSVKLQRTF